MSRSDRIANAVQSAVGAGVFPGAVLVVRLRDRVVYECAFGQAALIPEPEPATLQTIYDLASLTKPLATTTALLCLIQEQRLSLEQPVQDLLPELWDSEVGGATLFHLLNHSSGLAAWRPFYERIAERDRDEPGYLGSSAAKELVLDLIRQEALVYPIGTRSLYSDLGFMLVGFILERLTGGSLAAFCRNRVHGPMNAAPLFFLGPGATPPPGPLGTAHHDRIDRRLVAPTEDDPWRGRVLRGDVHDENAYAMGGVAGHAGLFGTASAVLVVSGCWLRAYLGGDGLLSPEPVRLFVSRQERTAGSSWGLGWDTPSAPSSSGTRFSPLSFGHLGYTGTSVWIDPKSQLEVVLLSNRVHPTRQNNGIQTFRPLIHDLVYEEFVG
jgi:CubicO group peptidase (beta-lactamase class C family)